MKTHRFNPLSLTILFLPASLSLGCSKPAAPVAGTPPVTSEVALAGTHEGAPAEGGSNSDVTSVTGTILETMDAAGYTYLKLKTAEGETWAAVNESKVEVGQTVTVLNPMPMKGFESKTLNRTFDVILFGTLAPGAGAGLVAGTSAAPAIPAATGGMGAAPPEVPASMAAQHAAAASGPDVTEKISVAKAEGADGRTVAEVFAQRATLKGKSVTIRGKVVKLNSGIMGKNWIHLRDGSGSPDGKDNDVTVTTNDTVAKGDVVVVKGTVAVDRDFGAGYTYTLVVEDAKVSKVTK